MDIKKGISYVAFGFLFTLININLTFNGATINIVPDFLGWILFFLAYDKLGGYMENRVYLKWGFLIMAVFKGVLWILDFTGGPELGYLGTFFSLLALFLMYMLFGALEKVSHDFDPGREQTIYMLKILNLTASVAFVVVGLIMLITKAETLVVVELVIGLAALVLAVYTTFVLFGLRKAIQEEA